MQLMRRQPTWHPMRDWDQLSERFNRLFSGLGRWSGNGEQESLAFSDWASPWQRRPGTHTPGGDS